MQQRQNRLNSEMLSCVHPVKVPRQPESTLARVSQQLSHLEKRDWELWAVVCFTSMLVGVGRSQFCRPPLS